MAGMASHSSMDAGAGKGVMCIAIQVNQRIRCICLGMAVLYLVLMAAQRGAILRFFSDEETREPLQNYLNQVYPLLLIEVPLQAFNKMHQQYLRFATSFKILGPVRIVATLVQVGVASAGFESQSFFLVVLSGHVNKLICGVVCAFWYFKFEAPKLGFGTDRPWHLSMRQNKACQSTFAEHLPAVRQHVFGDGNPHVQRRWFVPVTYSNMWLDHEQALQVLTEANENLAQYPNGAWQQYPSRVKAEAAKDDKKAKKRGYKPAKYYSTKAAYDTVYDSLTASPGSIIAQKFITDGQCLEMILADTSWEMGGELAAAKTRFKSLMDGIVIAGSAELASLQSEAAAVNSKRRPSMWTLASGQVNDASQSA